MAEVADPKTSVRCFVVCDDDRYKYNTSSTLYDARPRRHPPSSPNPKVPEEFRCSGTDLRRRPASPALSSHGPVLATTHFPLKAAAHTR